MKNAEYAEESDLLYHLTVQHTFLYESANNDIYKDNLNALLTYINSDEMLRLVKPYVIFAVLARKTGMMQNRPYFMPNLKAVFQYQDYNIYKDNGKNFNLYQSELELYDHLQNIPMRLSRKIQTVMPKSFPDILSYMDYNEMNDDEVQLYGDAAFELKYRMLQTAEKFLKI